MRVNPPSQPDQGDKKAQTCATYNHNKLKNYVPITFKKQSKCNKTRFQDLLPFTQNKVPRTISMVNNSFFNKRHCITSERSTNFQLNNETFETNLQATSNMSPYDQNDGERTESNVSLLAEIKCSIHTATSIDIPRIQHK